MRIVTKWVHLLQVEEYHLRYNTEEKTIRAEEVDEEGQIVLSVAGASGIEVLEARIKYEGFEDLSEWGNTVRNWSLLIK